MANPLASGIVPAQLSFLAIYNPGLGTADETLVDQIVYYTSASTLSASRRRRHRSAKDGRPADKISNEERNERLRQIGLAQGMVEFGRSFSGGKPVDSIDTERSRVVLHELEPGWWILAVSFRLLSSPSKKHVLVRLTERRNQSIDLTRLPLPLTKTGGASPSATSAPPPPPPPSNHPQQQPPPQQQYEYSSREVKPAILLLRDLLRAHALFLLHHGPSLSSLFATSPSRAQFTSLLTRYWDLFLSTWHVLLHGNPACNVLGGIKIAACGELGIGVGEEDRGSGEREVLEGLVGRVEGLVDLVVGRFGNAGEQQQTETGKKGKGVAVRKREEEEEGWLGRGSEVGAEDGAVFLGVGAVSRRSLWALTSWMEDIYTWGESAYGVVDGSAVGGSRARRRKGAGKKGIAGPGSPTPDGKKDQGEGKATATGSQTTGDVRPKDPNATAPQETTESAATEGGMDKMFSYLKLGYGTYWSLGTSSPATNSDADDVPKPTETAEGAESQKHLKDLNAGYFLLGLGEPDTESKQPDAAEQETPTRPRTVTVELEIQDKTSALVNLPSTNPNNRDHKPKTVQLRPVIYVRRPFIYILLFQPSTPSPPWQDLSQSLHTQFTPLHKPLLTSTSYRPEKPNPGGGPAAGTTPQTEIYDLVFDPETLTIHSTIPNIPDPALPSTDPSSGVSTPAAAVWTRVEALNTHNQILNMFASTRADASALEATCKTSRGWWVVWNRVVDRSPAAAKDRSSPSSSTSADGSGPAEEPGVRDDGDDDGDKRGASVVAEGKEIFLVRRASDHGGAGVRGVSASYVGGAAGGWADGASRLAQGIGVDTRRYIEGLLSLNR
jgi:hypothetical protein